MKILFFIKITLFVSVFCFGNYLLVSNLIKPNADEFYSKVATPKSSNLILGSSRASQGLIPEIVFNGISSNGINFAFTMANSPYGETYFNAIKNKIDYSRNDGYFVFEVSPLALSSVFSETNKDSINPEKNYFLANLLSFSANPNFAYIYLRYKKPLYKLFSPPSSVMNLHANGWLEVNVIVDTNNNSSKIIEKAKAFELACKKRAFDRSRMDYLIKMIMLCKQHGKVVIVRLPVGSRIFDIERKYFADFDKEIIKLAKSCNVRYLDIFTTYSGHVKTVDGNHLWKGESKHISNLLNQKLINKN